MRDHVVDLTREPGPLSEGGNTDVHLAFGIEALRALAIGTRLRSPLTHRAPEEPRQHADHETGPEQICDDFAA